MTTHRFRGHLQPAPRTQAPGETTAFVPCPAFAALPPCRQAAVLEVYRVAAERTREQLRPQRPIPAFSLN